MQSMQNTLIPVNFILLWLCTQFAPLRHQKCVRNVHSRPVPVVGVPGFTFLLVRSGPPKEQGPVRFPYPYLK